MRVINADQGTPEWIASRIGVPSGSNFAKIMSKGKGSEPSVTRASYLTAIALEIVDEFLHPFETQLTSGRQTGCACFRFCCRIRQFSALGVVVVFCFEEVE